VAPGSSGSPLIVRHRHRPASPDVAPRLYCAQGVRMRAAAMVVWLVALCAPAAPLRAGEISPAVVFSIGDKFDGSFNEAAYRGAESFKQDTGIAYRDVSISNETQFEQANRRLAQRGANPIV